jgi:hypothetical protein
MRPAVIILVLAIVALAAAGLWFRIVPMPAATWHVEPAEVPPPDRPNFDLRVGDGAPILPASPAVVAARLETIARADGARHIGGDAASGHVTYVVRSRLMGFPDAISIRLVPVAEGTRLEVFSRARFGYSDMGVNAARIDRWLAALRAQTAP